MKSKYRFDEIIKEKIDQIEFNSDENEVNTILNKVQTNIPNQVLSKNVWWTYILGVMLLISLGLNFYLWKKPEMLSKKLPSMSDESLQINILKERNDTESKKSIIKQYENKISHKKNIIDRLNHSWSSIERESQKINLQPSKQAFYREEVIKSYDTINSLILTQNDTHNNSDASDYSKISLLHMKKDVKIADENAPFEKRNNVILDNLPRLVAPNLTYQYSLNLEHPIVPSLTKKVDIRNNRWSIGLKFDQYEGLVGIGAIGQLNLNNRFSLFGSINKYKNHSRHFHDRDELEKFELEDIYQHDFDSYSHMENIRELSKRITLSVGANYNLPTYYQFNLIGGAELELSIYKKNNLNFDYETVSTRGSTQLTSIYENYGNKSANLLVGLERSFGRFSLSLLAKPTINLDYIKESKEEKIHVGFSIRSLYKL